MKNAVVVAFAGITLALGACNNDDENVMMEPTPQPTLYEKLGGETLVSDPNSPGMTIEQGRLGLRSVVDSTIFVIAGTPSLQPYFEVLLTEVGVGDLTGFAMLSSSLTDFLAVATGAENYTYNGLDMVAAHDPGINSRMAQTADDQALDDFIGAVVVGATQNGLSTELINEVGALLETLREPIVQR